MQDRRGFAQREMQVGVRNAVPDLETIGGGAAEQITIAASCE